MDNQKRKAIYVDEDVHRKLFLLKLEKKKRNINEVISDIINKVSP